MIPLEGKNNFEMYYEITQTLHIFLNAFIYLLQKNSLEKFAISVNRFLEQNQYNFVNANGIEFKDIWNEYKPIKFSKMNFWGYISMFSIWIVTVDYQLIFYVEKSSDSPFPYYSPFINWGKDYKWIHIVFDTIMTGVILCAVSQPDTVLVTLLTFLRCQFLYLKCLLDEMCQKENKYENNKLWVEKHIKILNLAADLNDLLKPHITIKFFSLVFIVVFNVLMFMEVRLCMKFFLLKRWTDIKIL